LPSLITIYMVTLIQRKKIGKGQVLSFDLPVLCTGRFCSAMLYFAMFSQICPHRFFDAICHLLCAFVIFLEV